MLTIVKRSCLLAAVLCCFAFILFSEPADAFLKLTGQFKAETACEALQSVKRGTNPEQVTLTPGKTYAVLGQNKATASHYLLKLEEADPANRWVGIECGQLLANSAANPSTTTAVKPFLRPQKSTAPTAKPFLRPQKPVNRIRNDYLLALSWQPAFCETKRYLSECQRQSKDDFSASHFVLHGLWPQPRSNIYCTVNQQQYEQKPWSEMPPLQLSDTTTQLLASRMPGAESYLHRHEWYKHGTCYSEEPEEYYQESLALLEQVNRSQVGELFARNVGRSLTADRIREAFDAEFGVGAGNKVRLRCKGGLLTELWINLRGEIGPETPIERLIRQAPSTSKGCKQVRIDKVGFQTSG